MLTAEDEKVLLRQYLARLFDTFASINAGLMLSISGVCKRCLESNGSTMCRTVM